MNNINLPPNERWIDGYKGIYSITESAEVTIHKSGERKGLKSTVDSHGYFRVNLGKNSNRKSCLVHRLVASSFLENKNKLPQINHIDGNKLNNSIQNLEWCTQAHNSLHAWRTGLRLSNLTRDIYERIKILISEAKYSLSEIGRILNVSHRLIFNVKHNQRLKRFQ